MCSLGQILASLKHRVWFQKDAFMNLKKRKLNLVNADILMKEEQKKA